MNITSREKAYLKFKDGVAYMPGNNIQTYDYIDYDINETYFIESLAYNNN